jgi:hypothetical protein
MGLRASYQAAEDRMVLFLDGTTENAACWVSLRQWLGLLHCLGNSVLTDVGIDPPLHIQDNATANQPQRIQPTRGW